FGLSASSTGEVLKAYNAVDDYGGWVSGGSGHGSNAGDPKGFITIILFDKNYNFLDAAWDQLDDTYTQVVGQSKTAHDLLTKEVTVQEEGHAYVFISNESPTAIDIYFDDVTMTYTPSNVLQYNEYYPYGLQTSASWTRENSKNNFLYNAGSELNVTSGWYDLAFRNYDAALGRFMQVDPMSVSEQATYQYAGNNPVSFNDPLGDKVFCAICNQVDAKRTFSEMHARAVEHSQSLSLNPNSGDVLGDGFDGGGGSGLPSAYYAAIRAFERQQALYFQQVAAAAISAAEAAASSLQYIGIDVKGYHLGVLLDNGEISSVIVNSVDEFGQATMAPIIFDIESGYVGAGAQQVDSPGWMWHTSSSVMTTRGLNVEGELKNGIGFVFRVIADVTGEVGGDSYYDPVNTKYTNTTKKITEIGAFWEGGGSFQMTHENDKMGNLIDENYQINVGYSGFGLQVNWDSNGVKDVRLGMDSGFGFSGYWGLTQNFQMGLMYVNRPK
ncbi:MAG TPA: RHS repeat-associated core domain-containing protein, partial [Chryseosolibacter sp.]|nr:RHS repeat-associated core domain-containing protein [Chryseosolibacter sp.]